jgi:uncharacterized membrane protein
MTKPVASPNERMATVVGNVLRSGVTLAGAIVLLGGIVFLVRHGRALPDYSVFHGEPSDLCSPRGIVGQAVGLRGRGIIQLGLLLLIATPVMRVVVSWIGFARQRDWLYVAVSTVVLATLVYSFLGGSL